MNRFADATGDHQWIHVDVERATRESPFGGPIAHGYLTLSLTNLVPAAGRRGAGGLARASTTAPARCGSRRPVPVGSRVRGAAELTACDDIAGGIQTTIVITIEVEGGTKPACVVESLSRWLA